VLKLSIRRGLEFIGRGDKEILRSYDDLLNYVFKQIDSLKRLVTYIAEEDWELASNEAAMIGAFFSGLSEQFLELLEKARANLDVNPQNRNQWTLHSVR